MRRIINGKAYDTDTAREVGSWDNGMMPSDFDYCSETLYRKRNGEFFVLGEGGARSAYATHQGDRWGSGRAIRPLSYDEARQWAEDRLDAEGYEAAFGPAPEGESVMLSTRISPAARAALDREVERTGRTAASIVDKLLCGLAR